MYTVTESNALTSVERQSQTKFPAIPRRNVLASINVPCKRRVRVEMKTRGKGSAGANCFSQKRTRLLAGRSRVCPVFSQRGPTSVTELRMFAVCCSQKSREKRGSHVYSALACSRRLTLFRWPCVRGFSPCDFDKNRRVDGFRLADPSKRRESEGKKRAAERSLGS